jgi:hypothetical protein
MGGGSLSGKGRVRACKVEVQIHIGEEIYGRREILNQG